MTSASPAASSGGRGGGGSSVTWNSSVWTPASGTPRSARILRALITRPYGPQRNHSSTPAGSRSASNSARNRSSSSRPDSSAASCASRESTWIRCRRAGYRSFRSASSSANITDRAYRLPYSTVNRLSGSTASAVATSDSTGVIPEPATTAA